MTSKTSKIEFVRQYSCAQTVFEILETSAPHQRALLSVLAVSNRNQLDPVPLLLSLADELPTAYRKRVAQLAEKKSEGVETVVAIEEISGLLSASVVLALRLARDNGTLTELFDVILNRYSGNGLDTLANHDAYLPRLMRLAGFGFAVMIIMTFIMVKIVPEFQDMLEEFQVELPASLVMLIAICDFAVKFWFVTALFFLGLIPFCFASLRNYVSRWSRFTWQQRRLAPSVNRRRSLALVSQAGLSVKSGITLILGYRPLRRIFRKLKKAERRIDNGQADWQALAAENIISRRDAEALTLSTSSETQAWLLRWSATARQARYATRMGLFARGFSGLVYVAIGLLIALTAVSIFMTLISIMSQLQ